MAENSIIAWTHNTANAWIGCTKKSDGCKNCYAETLVVNRMGEKGLWGPVGTAGRRRTGGANWAKFRRWNKQAEKAGVSMRVFLGSLMDIFESHPDLEPIRDEVWQLIRVTPFIQWQALTKRPENIRSMLPADWGEGGYHNVWLGTSIESETAKERNDVTGEMQLVTKRREVLAGIPAAVRFISYEPALGPLSTMPLSGIDWLIGGGESGPGWRPMDLQWQRDIRERCATPRGIHDHTTAYFFKQSAAPRTEMGTKLDGETVRNYPVPRSAMHKHRAEYSRMTDEAFNAQRQRIRYDLLGKPSAPFFDEAHENSKRAEVRGRQPLPLLDER